MFKITRFFVLLAAGILLSTSALRSQEPASYRGFALGASVQAVTALVGPGAGAVHALHQRPSLIQTMVWRRPYTSADSNPALRDPVREIEFNFYEDQLSQIVVDYDPDRTRGMTAADIVEALSTTYGMVSRTTARAATGNGENNLDDGRVIGRWGDADFSAVVYQETSYSGPNASRFKLFVTSTRLSALSRTAVAQSLRLDEREAPAREVARAKKEADDERAMQNKAGVENKAAFKP